MQNITVPSVFNDLNLIRQQGPLVHNITNYVAMQPIANMLLALGAAPLMAQATDELEDLSKISRALVLNIGTLDLHWIRAMRQAQSLAHQRDVPVVLDPVGAGASSYRTQSVLSLLEGGIDILRGNASEIMALVDQSVITKGVEATVASTTAQSAAQYLAKKYSCITVISGATDIIIDQERCCYLRKPNFSLLTKVTAMGCSATAMIGAFAAVNRDYFTAAVHAMTVLGVAAEKAMQQASAPGTFFIKLLDALYQLTVDDLVRQLTIRENQQNKITEIIFLPR